MKKYYYEEISHWTILKTLLWKKKFTIKLKAAKIEEILVVLLFTDVQVKYLGCFVDDASRKLKTYLGASSTNTPTECLRRCTEAGYIYSGNQVYFIVMTL